MELPTTKPSDFVSVSYVAELCGTSKPRVVRVAKMHNIGSTVHSSRVRKTRVFNRKDVTRLKKLLKGTA